MKIEIVKVRKKDIKDILALIYELALYEKLENMVLSDEKALKKALFKEKKAEILILKYDGKIAGYALYFYSFSSFLLKKGLYLEDLFVREEYRNLGIGKKLFAYLIKKAKEEDCGRIEWCCLKWNSNSLEFYKKLHARELNEWVTLRLEEKDFNNYPYSEI